MRPQYDADTASILFSARNVFEVPSSCFELADAARTPHRRLTPASPMKKSSERNFGDYLVSADA
jgi:hypothetical protein